MTDAIRVFINGSKVDLTSGSTVADALRMVDDSWGEKLAQGSAYVTDGRGIEIEPSTPVTNGSILRVVVRARRGTVDADP
jgi:hypothetical protein